MAYYCSEKFRANANQSRVDIWLIYKCVKCDNTCKLSIYKGIRPHELAAGLFDKFVNNDAALAWEYAFDRNFLKQHECVVDYSAVEYEVNTNVDIIQLSGSSINGATCSTYNPALPVDIHVSSHFSFELKLVALLARMLDMSIGQIKRLADMGKISTSPEVNLARYRIKSDHSIVVAIASHTIEPLTVSQFSHAVDPVSATRL